MKRGRPNIRNIIISELIEILKNSRTPLTTSNITTSISKKLNKKISWNTIQKYINELLNQEKINYIILPHSKNINRNGLTVYSLKYH